jgi:small-conductance mechanosensitive channel
MLAAAPAARAQAPPAAAAPLSTSPSSEPSTFSYFNRPIVVLKANVLGRSPAERAAAAEHALDDLVEEHTVAPVEFQLFPGGSYIRVGSRVVLGLTSADVDNLSGETLEGVSAQAVARLQQALAEVEEAQRPGLLLRGAILALIAIFIAIAALWGLYRLHHRFSGRLVDAARKTVASSRLADAEVLRSTRLADFERRLVTTAMLVADLFVIYWVVTFTLRQFPYTRPWGESLRGFLIATVEHLGFGMLNALPGLFTVAVIFLIARFLVRLVGLWFRAIERGGISVPWIYPETAQPTRRLVSGGLWLFAIVAAYPYLPGSNSEAFKGVSVLIGLMISLGSSGFISHVMSGFMITYSRSLRRGDFVRIGDVEGTVAHLGVLSTKITTPFNEDITIPNAVVVSQTMTDYSRFADTVFTSTSVTIGYDTPWRQIHAMLLQAAARTSGLRSRPEPRVLQSGLEDFYVRYTLFVCLDDQKSRPFTLAELHANIQDVFNEYGVQIMSPNYMLDPAAPKVVAKKDWFAAPAAPDGSTIPR